MKQKSHEVDYKIFGDDIQFVEVELDSHETVIAEAGAVMYMEEGIVFHIYMGDSPTVSTTSKLEAVKNLGRRVFAGKSVFITHFTNKVSEPKRVAFGAHHPGKILGVNLAEISGDLICQKNAFLAAALGTEITVDFNKRFGPGLFGRDGYILQRLQGDGNVFIHVGGDVIEKQLSGEKLYINPGCIVAFESTIDYRIKQVGNLKSQFFAGDGLFVATLEGTGRLWMQSLPFSRLADRIIANAPSMSGNGLSAGSMIDGLFVMGSWRKKVSFPKKHPTT